MPLKSESIEVNGVAVKLPEFFNSNLEIWFAQAEAQFALDKITEEVTKYYHMLKGLDEQVTVQVRKWARKQPAVDPYTKLKSVLLEKFTPNAVRAQSFFHAQLSGDKQQSDIMNNLILLGQECCTTTLVLPSHSSTSMQAFLLQLFPHVRAAIGGLTSSTDLVEYAKPLLLCRKPMHWEAAQAAGLSVSLAAGLSASRAAGLSVSLAGRGLTAS